MPTMRLDPSVIAPVKRRERENLTAYPAGLPRRAGLWLRGQTGEVALPRRHEFARGPCAGMAHAVHVGGTPG